MKIYFVNRLFSPTRICDRNFIISNIIIFLINENKYKEFVLREIEKTYKCNVFVILFLGLKKPFPQAETRWLINLKNRYID